MPAGRRWFVVRKVTYKKHRWDENSFIALLGDDTDKEADFKSDLVYGPDEKREGWVFWAHHLRRWEKHPDSGTRYPTRDAAEAAAFKLALDIPKLIHAIMVIRIPRHPVKKSRQKINSVGRKKAKNRWPFNSRYMERKRAKSKEPTE